MARIDVIMPQMGESITEGTLSKWLKQVGDDVKRDEPIFEISTDKVDAEIPSPSAGVLAEVLVQQGETVAVQTVVARIETDAASAASPPKEAKGPPPRVAAPPPTHAQLRSPSRRRRSSRPPAAEIRRAAEPPSRPVTVPRPRPTGCAIGRLRWCEKSRPSTALT